MQILVTGASGLLGKNLIRRLLREGHRVRALVRNPDRFFALPADQTFAWHDQSVPPAEAFRGVHAVVHLAGEGIADGRWSARRKARLRASRVDGTRNLLAGIARLPATERPQTLLAASAIGFYGDTGDRAVTEATPAGNGFLAELCGEWERAALTAETLGLRTVLFRNGLVLAREGGALPQMGPATLGNGRQWMSWIHLEDFLRATLAALADPRYDGAYNLVTPAPVTNREFTRALIRQWGFPFALPAPAPVLRLALGEMAGLLLDSQRVLPERLLAAGFRFAFPDLPLALRDLYGADSYLDQVFHADQFVPFPPAAVFPFFGKAENLETLTPPWLHFRIVRQSTARVEPGTLIDYRLRIHGVPVSWRTRITEWQADKFFVDDQLRGPYRRWHHRHHFDAVEGGTLLRDEITYRVPLGLPGKFLLGSWVRRDVAAIFGYRQEKIRALAGKRALR